MKQKTKNLGWCLVSGCGKKSKTLEMCQNHYLQVRRGTLSATGIRLVPEKQQALGHTCKMPDCGHPVAGHGFCERHIQQFQDGSLSTEGVRLREITERPKSRFGPCIIKDCGRPIKARRFCGTHYWQHKAGMLDESGNVLRERKPHGKRHGKDVWTASGGYVKVRAANHPYADRYGFVLGHRLVMEKVVGRFLQPYELVHHRHGRRDDNRPENLELMTKKSHPHGHEWTGSIIQEGLDALRHNDPAAYQALAQKIAAEFTPGLVLVRRAA